MPEALTESFCERCGTRYEFAAPTRLGTLRKTRGLISGLRNYIMSQDALGDAVGDAMRSEEEALAAAQLDAFHDSFNFCIQCRQYACTNCWNEPEGRCRTCVPIPGTDDLLERFEASFQAQHPGAEPMLDEADLNRRLGVDAWPSEDLGAAAATNGNVDAAWPHDAYGPEPGDADGRALVEGAAPAAEVAPPPVDDVQPAALLDQQTQEAVPHAEADLWAALPAPAPAADQAAPMLPAIEGDTAPRWESDDAFELEPEAIPEAAAEVTAEPEPIFETAAEVTAEPEPIFETAAEVTAEPEPIFETAAEIETVTEIEPEPVPIAEVAPEPEPQPPARPRPIAPITPISETILRIPRATPQPSEEPEPVAAQADDPELAARRAKLDLLGLGDPGEGPVSTSRGNVLPYRSSGASVHPAELTARGDVEGAAAIAGSFWEASSREVAGVMTAVGVQSCGHCGLSLSASARFCRRCGTRQARSA